MMYIQIYNIRICGNQVFFLFSRFSSSRRKLKTLKLRNLKTLYTYSVLLKNPIDQHSSEFMCLRSNHQNRCSETSNKNLKIVKKEYIYEVASLKSSTLQDNLELLPSFFFSKDLAKV